MIESSRGLSKSKKNNIASIEQDNMVNLVTLVSVVLTFIWRVFSYNKLSDIQYLNGRVEVQKEIVKVLEVLAFSEVNSKEFKEAKLEFDKIYHGRSTFYGDSKTDTELVKIKDEVKKLEENKITSNQFQRKLYSFSRNLREIYF